METNLTIYELLPERFWPYITLDHGLLRYNVYQGVITVTPPRKGMVTLQELVEMQACLIEAQGLFDMVYGG